MKERILREIRKAGKNGILQGELTKLYSFSKSTVSTVLKTLEEEGEIVRVHVAGKSRRIWGVENSPFPVKGHLRIGILKAIEYPAVLLAYLDCREIKVHLRLYNSAFSLTRDLAEGYLDAGCSPLITQTLFALVYRTIRINAGCGYNGGGIVFGKPGEVFGSSELSSMEYNLHRYMDFKGMRGVIRHFPSPQRMIKALERGEINAIAIWEPYLTKLAEKYRIVRFEEMFGEYPCCTLASNTRMENVEEYKTFLRRYIDAFAEIESRKDELISLESQLFKIPKRDIARAFHGFRYDYRLPRELALSTLENFGLRLGRELEERVFNLI